MTQSKKAHALGFNHIALEVGDVEEALAFYARIVEFKLRSKEKDMAFIDLGDQFLALQKGQRRTCFEAWAWRTYQKARRQSRNWRIRAWRRNRSARFVVRAEGWRARNSFGLAVLLQPHGSKRRRARPVAARRLKMLQPKNGALDASVVR